MTSVAKEPITNNASTLEAKKQFYTELILKSPEITGKAREELIKSIGSLETESSR